MTTLDYDKLGQNEETRARRFKVLQLQNKGANPPEIAFTLGLKYKTVQNDLRHIKQVQLHETDLRTIREDGANFYELKVRELSAQIAAIAAQDRKTYQNYILGLEKLIQTYKEQSMKIQGAYLGTDVTPPPVKIIFEEVRPGRRPRVEVQDPAQEEEALDGDYEDADDEPAEPEGADLP